MKASKKQNDRLDVLRSIILHREIRTQEEMIRELAKTGFIVTQGTLSRDLQRLRASKVVAGDGYRYVLPEMKAEKTVRVRVAATGCLYDSAFIGYEVSGNILIVHTQTGFAMAMANDIDQRAFDTIAGTVAGVNTIMVIVRHGYTPDQAVEDLATFLPIQV